MLFSFFFFSFFPLQDPPSVINIIPYTVFKVISGSAEAWCDVSTDRSQRVRLKNKLEADSLHPPADVLYECMHIERSLFQTAPSLSITSALFMRRLVLFQQTVRHHSVSQQTTDAHSDSDNALLNIIVPLNI